MRLMIQLGIALSIVLAVLVGAVIGADFYRSLPKNAHVVPMGQDIVYGDHGYAVLAIREEATLGAAGETVLPSGRFLVLTVRVSNYATNSEAYPFRPWRIRLEAEDGKEIRLSSAGQEALQSAGDNGCETPIPVGSNCTVELAFDVPRKASGLRATAGTNLALLNTIERIKYGKQLVALTGPVSSQPND